MVRQYQEHKNNTKIIIEVILPSTEPEESVANKKHSISFLDGFWKSFNLGQHL